MSIYGIYKNGTNEKKNGTNEPSRELVDTVGDGEGGTNWESCTDIYALSCVDFPGAASGKETTCQCKRYKKRRFDPWVGKLPWRRAWQRTPVFLPGESHEQRSLEDYSP